MYVSATPEWLVSKRAAVPPTNLTGCNPSEAGFQRWPSALQQRLLSVVARYRTHAD